MLSFFSFFSSSQHDSFFLPFFSSPLSSSFASFCHASVSSAFNYRFPPSPSPSPSSSLCDPREAAVVIRSVPSDIPSLFVSSAPCEPPRQPLSRIQYALSLELLISCYFFFLFRSSFFFFVLFVSSSASSSFSSLAWRRNLFAANVNFSNEINARKVVEEK